MKKIVKIMAAAAVIMACVLMLTACLRDAAQVSDDAGVGRHTETEQTEKKDDTSSTNTDSTAGTKPKRPYGLGKDC